MEEVSNATSDGVAAVLKNEVSEVVNSGVVAVVSNDTVAQQVSSSNSWQQLSLVALLCLLIAVTVVGNTLIIVAVITTRRLRTVTNCFVMSLAVADWLVGIFVMPPAVAYHLMRLLYAPRNCGPYGSIVGHGNTLSFFVLMGSWELGWIFCDIWISLDVLLCTASILSLCAISVDRYLAVTQPLNYSRRRRSKRLALFMILIVWLAALAITCPPIFGWYESGRHAGKTCRYNKNTGYVVFSAMGSFFLPLVVMVYVYARISCVVSQRHNQLTCHGSKQKRSVKLVGCPEESDVDRALSSECEEGHLGVARCTSLPTDVLYYTNNHHHLNTRSIRSHYSPYCASPCKDHPGGGNPFPTSATYYGRSPRPESLSLDIHSMEQNNTLPPIDTSSGRVSSFRRESKTAQTLSIVVGGFVACWLPFFICYLLTPFINMPPLLVGFLTWLGWINSAINPFIYAFYSPDFRIAFWRLTFRHCSGPRRPTDPAFGLK